MGDFARQEFVIDNPNRKTASEAVGAKRDAALAISHAASHVAAIWGQPVQRSAQKIARFLQT